MSRRTHYPPKILAKKCWTMAKPHKNKLEVLGSRDDRALIPYL